MAESIDRVIIEYGIEIAKLKADLEKVKAELGLVGAAGKQATDETQKGFDGVGKAAKKGAGEANKGFGALGKVLKDQLNPIKALKGALMGLGIAGIATMTAMLVGQLVKMGKEFFAASKAAIAAKEKMKMFAETQKEIAIGVETERVKITQLLLVARDEKRSKEDRLAAIKALNKISPEHLGNLTLETIHLNATTAAIDEYIKSAEKRITMKVNEGQIFALIEKRQEEEIKLTELQEKLRDEGAQHRMSATNQEIMWQTLLIEATQKDIDKLVEKNVALFDVAGANVAVTGSTRELEEELKQLQETQKDLVRGTPEYAAGLRKIADLEDILTPKIKEQKEAAVGLIGTLKDEIATLKEQVLVEKDLLKLRELQSKIVTKEAALEVLEDPVAAAAKLAALNKKIASDELATTIEQTKTTFDAQDLLIKENYATLLTDQTLSEDERKKLTADYDAAILLSHGERLAKELLDLMDYQLSVEGLDGQIADKTLEIAKELVDNKIALNEKLAADKKETDEKETESTKKQLAIRAELVQMFADQAAMIADTAFQVQQNKLDDRQDAELQQLQKLRDDELITDEQYNSRLLVLQKKQFEEDKQMQLKELAVKQAIAIASIWVQALASPASVATFGVSGAAAAAIITATLIAQYLAQLAIINSQKFATGVIDLQGKGTGTSDSIPARLSAGESVMTAKETQDHGDLLWAIRKDNVDEYIMQSMLPLLQKKGTLGENLGSSLLFDDSLIVSGIMNMNKTSKKNTKALIEALTQYKGRRAV